MAEKLDHKFWARYFKVYDVLNMVIPYQELLDSIVKELDIKKGDLVLDAGCGTGNLAIKMTKKGAKVIGIDYCIEALDIYKQKDPSAEVLVHDLTKPLPFPDSYFDKIACMNVLYALDRVDQPRLIKEFNRILKDGGFMVLTNPTENNPTNIYKDHLHKFRKTHGLLKTLIHISRSVPSMISMFYCNKKIVNNLSQNFPKLDYQKHISTENRFDFLSSRSVYSGESILTSWRKNDI